MFAQMRYRAPAMARSAAFEDPMASARSGSSWKSLFWIAFGMAGVGFAGWVYLVPYQKMQHAVGSHQSDLSAERSAAESAATERDKLKAEVSRLSATVKEKEAGESKRKDTVEALVADLKPGLEELGATIMADGGMVQVSFAAGKLIDKNGIDVSDGGMAAVKILAGAAKKEGASIRIHARSSAAPPPRELKALFHSAGEMNAVRAARMLSALESAGLGPTRITIIGQPAAPVPRAGRSKKAAPPAAPDRVELDVQPE
jgi:hypothetical protein